MMTTVWGWHQLYHNTNNIATRIRRRSPVLLRRRQQHQHRILVRSSNHHDNHNDNNNGVASSTNQLLRNQVFTRIDRTLSYKANATTTTTFPLRDDENGTTILTDLVSHIQQQQQQQRYATTTTTTTTTSDSYCTNDNVKVSNHTNNDDTSEAEATPSSSSSSSSSSSDMHVAPSISTDCGGNPPSPPKQQQQQQQQQHPDYSSNPTITTTALAHSLWSHVLRPGVDTAIDATAGNGYDALVLAKLLFPQYNHEQNSDGPNTTTTTTNSSEPPTETQDTQSMLYAMDVQLTACQTTTARLSSVLPPHIMANHVQIWHTSHETLDMVTTNNVALIVYNLGFLPGQHSQQTNDKSITTQTKTTITSLGNAVPLLRIGGMVSVTTYPRTNPHEDAAVRTFLECLALFSSQTQSWTTVVNDFVVAASDTKDDTVKDDDVVTTTTTTRDLREHLRHTLQMIHDDNPHQKWRVTQHAKLGRRDAPILLTAVRIQ